MSEVRAHLTRVPGVVDVHDVHVWTITSGVPALTAHVAVDRATLDECGPASMLHQLQDCAKECFQIEHTTFQVEPIDHWEHEHGAHK